MAHVAVVFQVPLREDRHVGSGRLHPAQRWKSLQDVLYERFGGWTEIGEWRGAWRSPNSRSRVSDVSRAFQIDADEKRLAELKRLLRRVCRTFVQQSIRVVIRGEVFYLEASPHDSPL